MAAPRTAKAPSQGTMVRCIDPDSPNDGKAIELTADGQGRLRVTLGNLGARTLIYHFAAGANLAAATLQAASDGGEVFDAAAVLNTGPISLNGQHLLAVSVRGRVTFESEDGPTSALADFNILNPGSEPQLDFGDYTQLIAGLADGPVTISVSAPGPDFFTAGWLTAFLVLVP